MKNILRIAICMAAVLVMSTAPRAAWAVFDNFSDLNDTVNPAWTRLNGLVMSMGQTWDVSTGQYHMTAPNNGVSNFGFVGSITGPSFTNVNVMADATDFVGSPTGGVFGVAARLNGSNAFAQLTGYAYAYEPFSAGGAGEFSLYRISPGLTVDDIGSDGVEGVDFVRKVTLDPNKDYTFSLSVIGTQLKGEVREVGSGNLVAYQSKTDATYASGFSGLISYSQTPLTPTNVTWDNFKAQVPEPATCLLVGLGTGLISLRRREYRGR